MLGRTPPWATVTLPRNLFADGELDVSRDDPAPLVVLGGVAGQLEELGGEVLEYRGHVDRSSRAGSLGEATLAEVASHAADGELETCLGAPGCRLALSSLAFSHLEISFLVSLSKIELLLIQISSLFISEANRTVYFRTYNQLLITLFSCFVLYYLLSIPLITFVQRVTPLLPLFLQVIFNCIPLFLISSTITCASLSMESCSTLLTKSLQHDNQ